METWEYLELGIRFGYPEGFWPLRPEDDPTLSPRLRALNQLGEQGWELVVYPGNEGVALFKRRRYPVPTPAEVEALPTLKTI